jgi:hypothetical protein
MLDAGIGDVASAPTADESEPWGDLTAVLEGTAQTDTDTCVPQLKG